MLIFFFELSQQRCWLYALLVDSLGVAGSAQDAAARNPRGMTPSVPLVVSPSLYAYWARRG